MQTSIKASIQDCPQINLTNNITLKSGGFPTYNNEDLVNLQKDISNLQKALLNGEKNVDLKYALKSKQLLELGHFHEKQVEKITDYEHQINFFKSKLEAEDNVKKELKIINFKLSSQLEETENKYLSQNDEIDCVKQKLEQKTKEVESSKIKMANDAKRFITLNENLDKITTEKLDLQNKYKKIESLYHQCQERNVELINENRLLQTKILLTSKQNDQFKSKLEDISKLKSKIKSSTDSSSNLKRKYDDAITEQGKKEKNFISKRKELETRISEDKEKIAKLTASVNEKNRKIINLSQAMNEDLNKFQAIRDQLDQIINSKTDHLNLDLKK